MIDAIDIHIQNIWQLIKIYHNIVLLWYENNDLILRRSMYGSANYSSAYHMYRRMICRWMRSKKTLFKLLQKNSEQNLIIKNTTRKKTINWWMISIEFKWI